jgi:hypothetical protein
MPVILRMANPDGRLRVRRDADYSYHTGSTRYPPATRSAVPAGTVNLRE